MEHYLKLWGQSVVIGEKSRMHTCILPGILPFHAHNDFQMDDTWKQGVYEKCWSTLLLFQDERTHVSSWNTGPQLTMY